MYLACISVTASRTHDLKYIYIRIFRPITSEIDKRQDFEQ